MRLLAWWGTNSDVLAAESGLLNELHEDIRHALYGVLEDGAPVLMSKCMRASTVSWEGRRLPPPGIWRNSAPAP